MLRTRFKPLPGSLSRTLTSAALALSLALTGLTATTAPASANGRNNQGAEAAAIFGGLLLLYGLSQAGQGNAGVSRGNGRPIHVQPHRPIQVQPHRPIQVQPHHPRPRQNHRVAPARCFVEGYSHGQRYRGYGARCMRQSVRAPHLLPQHCLRDIRGNQGPRRIYGGRCLANAGWVRG